MVKQRGKKELTFRCVETTAALAWLLWKDGLGVDRKWAGLNKYLFSGVS